MLFFRPACIAAVKTPENSFFFRVRNAGTVIDDRQLHKVRFTASANLDGGSLRCIRAGVGKQNTKQLGQAFPVQRKMRQRLVGQFQCQHMALIMAYRMEPLVQIDTESVQLHIGTANMPRAGIASRQRQEVVNETGHAAGFLLRRIQKGFAFGTVCPAGSGKTTTLACIVDAVNSSRNRHIITIEDPIEYLHQHKKSVVTQRELFTDTCSYDAALRAALREAPDIILVGEMRDADTIRAAVTAAETGHLVISTLHTVGASNTIDRIVDSFPPEQQGQIRVQLSMVLEGVVSQQLVTTVEGELTPAFEVMSVNSAVRNMIREAKTHQIDNVIAQSAAEGMGTMDQSLLDLVRKGRISREEALRHSVNSDWLHRRLSAAGE